MCPAQPKVAVVLFYSILVVTALVSVSLIFNFFLRRTAICFELIKLVLDTFDFSLFCIPIFSAFYTPSVSVKIALLNISEDISSELHHLIKQK